MGLNNEKYKNKLELTKAQKYKFSHFLYELPKGNHYIHEMEPLIGAAIDIECNNWVIIPYEIDEVRCDKLLLKSAVIIKCPSCRNVETPVKIHKRLWTVIDPDLKNRIELIDSKEEYLPVIIGKRTIKLRGIVYEHRISIHSKSGNYVKKNIGFQCFSVRKAEE